MKSFAILLALGIAVTAVGDTKSVRAAIDRQYKKWAKASVQNDVKGILAGLTSDYTLKTSTGKVIDRKTYENSLRKRKASGKSGSAYTTKIADLKVTGSTAVVISDEESVSTSRDPITKEPLKMIHTHRYLDTWVRSRSVWRLRSTVTQSESTKVVPAKKKSEP